MLTANLVAEKLSENIRKHGSSELTFAISIFSGKSSETAGISGQVSGRKFKVIMFERSKDNSFPAVSAHFSSDIGDLHLPEEKVAFWNADNRFTKLYRQDSRHAFLVYDSFFPSALDDAFIESVVNIWAGAMREISKL